MAKNNKQKKNKKTMSSEKKLNLRIHVDRGNGRLIRGGLIPRSHMRIHSHPHDHAGIVVKGCQIVSSLSASQDPLVTTFLLNPANESMFPTVAPLARPFQHYRFRRLRVGFTSGCASTLSGSVGIALSVDVTRNAPQDEVGLASYEASAVGSVGASFESTDIDLRNDRGVYNTTSLPDVDNADLTKVFQSVLYMLSSRARPDDHDVFAGYVSIEYDLELFDMAPPRASIIQLQPHLLTQRGPFGVLGDSVLSYDRAYIQNGPMGWQNSAAVEAETGTGANRDFWTTAENVAVKVGKWALNGIWDFASSAASNSGVDETEEKLDDFKKLSARPLYRELSSQLVGDRYKLYCNGHCFGSVPARIPRGHLGSDFGPQDAVDLVSAECQDTIDHHLPGGGLDAIRPWLRYAEPEDGGDCMFQLVPYAAGDITQEWQGVYMDGEPDGFITFGTHLLSNGTGGQFWRTRTRFNFIREANTRNLFKFEGIRAMNTSVSLADYIRLADETKIS